MATGAWPTIVDVASRMDPEGHIPVIAEMMSQCNDYYDDMPWVEANEHTGHEFVFRTSVPAGSWRSYNQGVPYSKSTTGKARIDLGMLADYSQVDKDLARHTGDAEKFRTSEDVAFLEGMSQTIAQTFFYGNSTINQAEFMGLAPFYNTVSTSTAQNAANVINGGGLGNNNASIYFIGWSPETIFAVFPRGTKAGLDQEDKGDVNPGYDSVGNRFEAYTTYFNQQAGLCPKDWRYGVRIANIDTTTAGLAGPNALDLFTTMGRAMMLFPKLSRGGSGITKTDAPNSDPSVRAVWYCNRTVRYYMDVQAMRDRNTLLQINDYAGMPVMGYRGYPVKIVDQLINTETLVS